MANTNEEQGWPWDAGLGWALVMAILELIETLALADVVLIERRGSDLSWSGNPVVLYFWLVAGTFAFQIVGIILVVKGRYRAGGALQIAGSVLHLIKIEGIIGIIGGMRARQAATAEDDAESP